MHVPKPKEKDQSPGRYQILSKYQIIFEQTMDIKEKFMQHGQIGTNLKRQDCTEHMHCEIPLNTQISKFKKNL